MTITTAGAENNVPTETANGSGRAATSGVRDSGEPHDGGPHSSRNGGNALVTSGESAALLSMIERAASDPRVDIDKMERLFVMHERVEKRRAEQAYNAAMAAAQEAMPAVVKNKTNDHTKARYADLYAIADECLPIAHKHGFGLSFSECKATEPSCMGISCRVSHSGGHAEVYTFNVPIDAAGSQGKVNKTVTQAYGSTFTYGRRYATCGVFNIIITDKDGNATHATISDEQAEQIKQALDETGGHLPRFCAYFKLEKLTDLPASKFDAALASIHNAAKRRATQ